MTDVALPTGSDVIADRKSASAGRHGPLTRWLVDRAAGSLLLDAVLRRRAHDICKKTGLLDHVAPEGVCIDIGAGLGHMMERIISHRPTVTCLGIDPKWPLASAVAYRLRCGAPVRARSCRGDGRALPLADGSVSTALVAFVLHHLCPTDQEAVLSEAARVIRPGGTLILLEDTPGSEADRRLIEAADRRLNLEGKGEIHAYRSPEEWRLCLRRSSFDVRAAIPFTRVFPPATLRPVPHHAFICAAPSQSS